MTQGGLSRRFEGAWRVSVIPWAPGFSNELTVQGRLGHPDRP